MLLSSIASKRARGTDSAQALVDVLPNHLPHVFLANSGAEAVDGALEVRAPGDRQAVVRGRHERLSTAVPSAPCPEWEPSYARGFQPLLDTTHVPFNDVAALEAAIGDTTAAVILEVVQGESGVNVGSIAFLQAAQRLCRERGALLIVDEISDRLRPHRALVRRGARGPGARHHVLGAGLGGGFPMGAIAYTEDRP